jgi:hypothetical protein
VLPDSWAAGEWVESLALSRVCMARVVEVEEQVEAEVGEMEQEVARELFAEKEEEEEEEEEEDRRHLCPHEYQEPKQLCVSVTVAAVLPASSSRFLCCGKGVC